jgi:hypothetical protein
MHNKIVASALKAKIIFILRDPNVPKPSLALEKKNRYKNKNIKRATPKDGAPQAFLDAP